MYKLTSTSSRVYTGRHLDEQRLNSLRNLQHCQNVIICSLAHYQHFLNISFKSFHNFSSYFAY